ncbi:VCBS domain-containing protein [uncultured Desulfovibrio sp.]|uniref:VCBS domain-containing protein n=1 Tax=uncultured Desulfovibrio sp. TaxID=167968 RepID=UPI002626A524|nr:VCBS domain-containing protein [uncultured Desulfovibrio sp.]
MADIRLAKPAAGTTQTVPSAPEGRFVFEFPADAATLSRSGDNLVLTFEDGASIQLQDFYTTYSKEEMPSFQVDGVEIAGADFFAALGEDLMPAAGPASSSAARSGRYNEYGDGSLLDGIDHLGRLDIGFDGGVQLATDMVDPSAWYDDDGGRVDHGVTVTPTNPAQDPDDLDIPVQGGENFPPTMPHDVLRVDESALPDGSGGGKATAAGSMSVSAPDGVATITIGGDVVWQNGALTGTPVNTDEGHLNVTGFDGTNLTYTYTLTDPTREHTKQNAGGEDDAIAHEMEVVVTDRDGDSGSAVIRVEITDDVPTIKSFEHELTEGGEVIPVFGNALTDAVAGADGADFAWDANLSGQYGNITLNPDGTYIYTLDNDNEAVKALSDGETLTEEFTYTYTDADGDVAEGKVTITINGVDNGVVVTPSDPEAGSETLTVYESGLADGSTPGEKPTTAEGSMNIDAPDGVASIVIGGVTVFENGALTSNTVPTDEGVLTVTGFDAATGELKFTYTLNDNTLEHNTEATDTQVSHDLAVTVTDVDGTPASGTIRRAHGA